VERNQTFLQAEARPKVTFLNPVEPEIEALLFGPETSGGLFLAVAEAQTVRLEHLFEQAGQPLWQVGYTQSGSGLILVA
jgi:hypothetical protein